MPDAKTSGVSPISEKTLTITSNPTIEDAKVGEAIHGPALIRASSQRLPEVDSHNADSAEMSIENSSGSSNSFERLDVRSIVLEKVIWRILIAASGVVLLLGWLLVGLLFMRFERPLWIALASIVGILACLIWASRSLPKRVYATTSWQIRPTQGLEIRRGIWWHHRIFIPRNRIQHTDVRQGPLERRFGLATLIVNTGGTHEPSISLSGLAREHAERLRDQLCEVSLGQ